MKRITALALFALAGILGAGNALAQGPEARATVPFDFTVGNKMLPAGNYAISAITDNTIEIKNRDKEHVVMLTPRYVATGQSSIDGKLVFDRYGDQYFLREILCESAALDVDLPPSKFEMKARTQEASLRDASQTLVALK